MLVDTRWAGRKHRDRVLCLYTDAVTVFVTGERYSIWRNKSEVSWCLRAANSCTAGLHCLLFQGHRLMLYIIANFEIIIYHFADPLIPCGQMSV
jgi:hypothetical protein